MERFNDDYGKQDELGEIADDGQRRNEHEGFTLSVVIVSLVALVGLAFMFTRAMFMISRHIDHYGVPSRAALAVVLPVGAIGLLYTWLRKKELISHAQLVTLYAILSLGSVVMGFGGFWILVGNIAALPSLASGFDPRASGFAKRFASLLTDISSAVVPRVTVVQNGFFRGQATVPWGDWILPIFLWTLYFAVFFWVCLCIAAMFHRHWSEVLHLPYPLVEPVLEMTKPSLNGKGGVPAFWKDRLMWIGASIPLFIGVWNDIIKRLFLKGAPLIDTYIPLGDAGSRLGGIWSILISVFPPIQLNLDPLVIGVGYFVSNSILFSIVFFYFVAQRLPRLIPIFIAGNYSSTWGLSRHAWMYDQFHAGMIWFAVITVYMSREHLRQVWLAAIGRMKCNDEVEGLSYRVAVFGLIGGLIFIFFFNTILLKAPVWFTILYFAIALCLFFIFARARVQLGIPSVQYNSSRISIQFLMPSTGGKLMGESSILGAGFHTSLAVGYLGSAMAFMFESYQLADKVGMRRRSMSKALIFAVVAAMLIAFIVGLPYIYKYGYNMLGGHYQKHARSDFQDVSSMFFPRDNPEGTMPYKDIESLIAQIFAAIFVSFLAYMHSTFMWWPLHPVGYVMGVSETAVPLWSGFLIAWLIKHMLMRYGGARVFAGARPVFLGLIAGSAVWGVVVGLLGFIPGFFS